MEAVVLERKGHLYIAGQARLVKPGTDIASELAEATDWEVDKSNPMIKWITGDFVESDNPNQNKQFWTKDDLAMGEYSIRYAPLNMVHKVRQPVGFFAQTRQIKLGEDSDEAAKHKYKHPEKGATLDGYKLGLSTGDACVTCGQPAADHTAPTDTAAADDSPLKIQALSGLWSHVFPFEAALVDQADEAGNLYYSMECRGEKLECAGDNGCGEVFDYMAVGTHCEHLLERASVRHIINPTFRGGALIVPPVRPGWNGATASVFQEALLDAASEFAEQSEAEYHAAAAQNSELTPLMWEHLMAGILASSGAE